MVVDSGLSPLSAYSYRACILDGEGVWHSTQTTVETSQQACGGSAVGGYCWYNSGDRVSCSDACAPHGGYHLATRDYAGSNGTHANCEAVMVALGVGGGSVTSITRCGAGCVSGLFSNRRRDTVETTPGCTMTLQSYRACACNY